MSIPPNSPWRGCAANFPQPVSQNDELAAQCLVEHVYDFNCRTAQEPLPDIEFRNSSRELDIRRHVFRWDLTPYQQVFENGFSARRQQGTSDEIFFNLDHYVHHAGRPLDSTRAATHAFVSTTISCDWHPSLPNPGTELQVYRYEIYAPGGILIRDTLGDRYQYPSQDEVCFVAGIASQYVRSAQLFRLVRESNNPHTTRTRVDDRIILNGNFNPQSHPSRLLDIQRPVYYYFSDNREMKLLRLVIYRGRHSSQVFGDNNGERRRRTRAIYTSQDSSLEDEQQIPDDDNIQWYAHGVADSDTYINAAFRSSNDHQNEAYLFMKNEYVLLNYAPGITDDKIVNGPLLICNGFPSLRDTVFGEYGIDCAFACNGGVEAFIFSGNLCARINFAPGTKDDKILEGPMTISSMFPLFKNTAFASGVDAAFEATSKTEAYIFKDSQYALINYSSKTLVHDILAITEGFRSLKGSIFEDGIEAAFASHRKDEAYLFKGDKYALINFAPGTTDDYIIGGGVKDILTNWPSLRAMPLPRKNRGVDVHDHQDDTTAPERDHDEL